MGVESVGLAEVRRTADYQTTVYDCVSKLLEQSINGNQDRSENSADDEQGKVRVNFLISLRCHTFVTVT